MARSRTDIAVLSLPKTAVFIDGDWLQYAVNAAGVPIQHQSLATLLRDTWGHTTSLFFYLTVTPRKPNPPFINSLTKYGYELKLVGAPGTAQRYKSPIDIQIAMDIVDLPPEYDRVVLVSGDSDFVPALEKARTARRSTVVVAFPLSVSNALLASADRFVSLDIVLGSRSSPTRAPPRSAAIRTEHYFVGGRRLDPYLIIRQLFHRARQSVVVVDPYLDEQILLTTQLLSHTVAIELLTNRVPPDFCSMVKMLRADGYGIDVRHTKAFHDRFLKVDDQLWHSGHSFKDLGNKDSHFSQVMDKEVYAEFNRRLGEALAAAEILCA